MLSTATTAPLRIFAANVAWQNNWVNKNVEIAPQTPYLFG
jgi:hypothetical protein